MWSLSPLLRRERDQARLLDPAASPDPERRAKLERRANRPRPAVRFEAQSQLEPVPAEMFLESEISYRRLHHVFSHSVLVSVAGRLRRKYQALQ